MSSNINVQQYFTMKVGVNLILIIILFTIFLLQAWNTISKYRAARTNLQVSLTKFKIPNTKVLQISSDHI